MRKAWKDANVDSALTDRMVRWHSRVSEHTWNWTARELADDVFSAELVSFDTQGSENGVYLRKRFPTNNFALGYRDFCEQRACHALAR